MSEIVCSDIDVYFENFEKLYNDNSDLKIFQIRLEDYSLLIPQLSTFLNQEELTRARKYHFEKDANRYITCRALLRCILANQTGIESSKINIELNRNNKPYLASDKNIHFNLAHSEDYGIIAVSNVDVGVDLEYCNKNFEFADIMPSVFNPKEIETVLSNENKSYMFYKFWTRKEAVVKATGKGITDFLTQVQVLNGSQTVPSRILGQIQNLQVSSFHLNESYISAIALNSPNFKLETIKIFDLPKSIEELFAFSQNKDSLS